MQNLQPRTKNEVLADIGNIVLSLEDGITRLEYVMDGENDSTRSMREAIKDIYWAVHDLT